MSSPGIQACLSLVSLSPGRMFRWSALIAVGLLLSGPAARIQAAIPGAAVLEFQQPTNHSVFSNTDEIPVVMRAFAPEDVFLSAELFASTRSIATLSFCCWLCPCAHPVPGMETVLQIPVPRNAGDPFRAWQGWTNVEPGTYWLTARAMGENGTVVEAPPVNITVFDRRLYAQVRGDGSVALVIPGGSLVFGGYDLEVSEDLITWTRAGSFEPGNVAAFYLDIPPPGTARRFYRSVYLPPAAPAF